MEAKIDPFKIKKSTPKKSVGLKGVETPPNIAEAVDAYRAAQDKVKHFEGEASVYKDALNAYSKNEYAKRALKGDTTNFKLYGAIAQAMYIVMDKSSALTDEDIAQVATEFGEEAAKDLTENDYRTLKFNAQILESNYEAIVAALQTLPNEVLENLFLPMMLKTKVDVINKATKHAKTPEALQRLMELLKITNYIR